MSDKADIRWLTWAVRVLLLAAIAGTFGAVRMTEISQATENKTIEQLAELRQRTVTLEKLAASMPLVVKENSERMDEMVETLHRIDTNLKVHIAATARVR